MEKIAFLHAMSELTGTNPAPEHKATAFAEQFRGVTTENIVGPARILVPDVPPSEVITEMFAGYWNLFFAGFIAGIRAAQEDGHTTDPA